MVALCGCKSGFPAGLLDCQRNLKRNLDRLTVLDVLLIAALLALPGWALVRSWHASRGIPGSVPR